MEQVVAALQSITCWPESEAMLPPVEFEDYAPENPDHFAVRIQVFIGESVDDDADSFDAYLCTPSWFAEMTGLRGWTWVREWLRSYALGALVATGRGLWFISRWDPNAVREAMDTACRYASPGPDWPFVAERIGRLIPWEYEDRFDKDVNSARGLPRPGAERFLFASDPREGSGQEPEDS